jgi:hypothetical protein
MPRQIIGQVARGSARITFRTIFQGKPCPATTLCTGCSRCAADDRLRLFFRDLQTTSGIARLK